MNAENIIVLTAAVISGIMATLAVIAAWKEADEANNRAATWNFLLFVYYGFVCAAAARCLLIP